MKHYNETWLVNEPDKTLHFFIHSYLERQTKQPQRTYGGILLRIKKHIENIKCTVVWKKLKQDITTCHSSLPDWLAGADEWELGDAVVVDQDSQKGNLTIKLETSTKINCD